MNGAPFNGLFLCEWSSIVGRCDVLWRHNGVHWRGRCGPVGSNETEEPIANFHPVAAIVSSAEWRPLKPDALLFSLSKTKKKTGGQIDAESYREFLLGFPEFRWELLGTFFLRITWSCLESAVVASLTAVALVVPEFDQLGRAKNKWSPFSLRRNDIQLKQDDGKKRERKNYRSTRKWSRLSFFFCSSCSRAQFPDRFSKSKTKQ